jgi:hypothetical protein
MQKEPAGRRVFFCPSDKAKVDRISWKIISLKLDPQLQIRWLSPATEVNTTWANSTL